MSSFHYSLLSSELIESLTTDTERGLSTVALGPRFSSKHDLLRWVGWSLEKRGRRPVGPIRLLAPVPLTSAEEVRHRLERAIAEFLAGENSGESQPFGLPSVSSPLLAPVDEAYRRLGRPLALLLGNVDSLAYSLAQQLLEEIRVRAQEGWLAVVLSGETELRRITEGPLSAFECDRKIFVQGLDLPLFRQMVYHYVQAFGCDFEDLDAAAVELWDLTGGNAALLRSVLTRLIEQNTPFREHEPFPGPGRRVFTCQDLKPDSQDEDRIHLMFQGDAAFQGDALIRTEPGCWPQLERLLRGERVWVTDPNSPPTALEFAGIARRDKNELMLTPGLLGNYVRSYYTPLRFADLYAEAGFWDSAFARYAELRPVQRKRPTTLEEYSRFQPVVASFERELNHRAMEGTASLRALLARACALLFGYDRVSMWTLGGHTVDPLIETPHPAPIAHKELVREQRGWLLGDDAVEVFILESNRIVGIIRLPDLRSLQPVALVIEDHDGDEPQNSARSPVRPHPGSQNAARIRVLLQLVVQFAAIYQKSLAEERLVERQQAQSILSRSIDGLLATLGTPGQDIRTALEAADMALQQLGYDRTIIALLNPHETRIEGVHARGFQRRGWLLGRISYPITQDLASEPLARAVQVRHGKAILIEDASNHPGCDAEVVQAYNMRSKGIIPLLNPRGKPVGAFHVERTDRGPLTEEEGDDLLEFGRQLAVVLEQENRVHLLQRTLDMTQEPTLVLSPSGRLRYCNEAAATAIGLSQPPGWWWLDEAPTLPDLQSRPNNLLLKAITDAYQAALLSEYRQVFHLRQEDREVAQYDVIESHQFRNWNGRTSGAMVHVNQLQYVGMYIAALERIAKAHTTREATLALLDVARIFGHPFARLWVVDPIDPNILRLVVMYSMPGEEPRPPNDDEPSVQDARDDTKHFWERFAFRRSQKPRVFTCRSPLEEVEGSTVTLETGLQAEVIYPHPPGTPWAKRIGDIWIDFPLWCGDRCIAKLTLDGTERTSPEHVEMLAALSGFLANLLTTIADNENLLVEKEKLIASVEQSAERATATIAHGLARHLAPFDWLRFRYKAMERECSALAPINTQFLEILRDVDATLKRAKRLLRMVNAKPQPILLRQCLEKNLRAVFPEEADWQLVCDPAYIVPLDEGLFNSAFTELLDNCRYFTGRTEYPRVWVTASLSQRSEEQTFEIHVRDNGPGVPSENKAFIFDDFFTNRPEKEPDDLQSAGPLTAAQNPTGEGTGLGLAHTRRVIQAHRGQIEEIGTYGEGSHFLIVLPYYGFPAEEDK